MDIVSLYQESFCGKRAEDCAFSLIEYSHGNYVGVDAEGHAAVVVASSTPHARPFMQESRSLEMKCNIKVKCLISNKVTDAIVHAIICIPRDFENISLFLELADLLLRKSDRTAEGVLSVYNALSNFFLNNEGLSDNELLGLYGELFTMCDFVSVYDLSSCWQSTDRMKFDFSITEKIKVEVKSTIKSQRVHHFKHNQIVAGDCDVYVISYLMRPDDAGLSLYELVMKSKDLCSNDAKKVMKLQLIIKNVGIERLKSFAFNADYARHERRIYYSIELPHFEGESPDGVSSAEYDVDLTKAPAIPEETFLHNISTGAYYE